ncbi:MAG: TIGR02996 domain-containing protein [Gemmataceae bacterium]
MDDHAALLAAVVDRPDDDTPRLVLADYLDDHGEPDRAAFVRAQVRLARTPEWEPFAVECRYRRTEWSDYGKPFRAALPALPDGCGVEWAEPPFRRGFGWRVRVTETRGWVGVAPDLVRAAPVGALHLRDPSATLDDWRRLAAGAWMTRVREVHLEAAGSPVEPVRALATAGTLANLDALHFHRANLPGIDLLADDVLAGSVAPSLRELSFRLSTPASLDDLLDVLAAHAGRFEKLALRVMNLTGEQVRRWAAPGLHGLRDLDLSDNYVFQQDGARALADALAGGWTGHTLGLSRCGIAIPGVRALAAAPGMASVRRLDLSRNVFGPTGVNVLAASPHLAGLRALDLRSCGFGDQAVRRLVRGTFWPNLTELDLRGNPITDRGAGYLMAAPSAPDLTALLVSGRHLRGPARATLAKHYGGRLIVEMTSDQ